MPNLLLTLLTTWLALNALTVAALVRRGRRRERAWSARPVQVAGRVR